MFIFIVSSSVTLSYQTFASKVLESILEEGPYQKVDRTRVCTRIPVNHALTRIISNEGRKKEAVCTERNWNIS